MPQEIMPHRESTSRRIVQIKVPDTYTEEDYRMLRIVLWEHERIHAMVRDVRDVVSDPDGTLYVETDPRYSREETTKEEFADEDPPIEAVGNACTPTSSTPLFAPRPQEISDQFRRELTSLINCHSLENGSGTPDFILADMLIAHLEAHNQAAWRRSQWLSPAAVGSEKPEPPRAEFTFDKQTSQ